MSTTSSFWTGAAELLSAPGNFALFLIVALIALALLLFGAHSIIRLIVLGTRRVRLKSGKTSIDVETKQDMPAE